MEKDNTKYANTIIYKISCNNPEIKDIYVGHTTDFTHRKTCHKQNCKNIHNKLYNTINKNGGWSNWNMSEIAKYNCKNITEAKIKEQIHYELLKANLNGIPPYTSKKIEINEPESTTCNDENNDNSKCRFICKKCNYYTNKLNDLNRHIQTSKHKNKEENTIKTTSIKIYKCKCGKEYIHRQSLNNHKKKCIMPLSDNNIITNLVNENSEIKTKLLDLQSKYMELQSKMIYLIEEINILKYK
jgi:hypothetical protein